MRLRRDLQTAEREGDNRVNAKNTSRLEAFAILNKSRLPGHPLRLSLEQYLFSATVPLKTWTTRPRNTFIFYTVSQVICHLPLHKAIIRGGDILLMYGTLILAERLPHASPSLLSLVSQHMLITDLKKYAHHWSHNICSWLISQYMHIWYYNKFSSLVSQHMLISDLNNICITGLTTYAHHWSHNICSSLIPQHMLISDLTTYAHHWSHKICITGLTTNAYHWSHNICSSLISRHMLISDLTTHTHHWSISQHMLITGLSTYAHLWSHNICSSLVSQNMHHWSQQLMHH